VLVGGQTRCCGRRQKKARQRARERGREREGERGGRGGSAKTPKNFNRKAQK
jgi:hypothetical protein